MVQTQDIRANRRKKQAEFTVLIALLIGFFGAMLGVIYGVVLGDVTGPEAWIIGILTVLTTGLLFAVSVQPARATGAVTGILTIYLVLHLNAGSILAYRASPEIVYIIPYVTWFFPLALFHHFTNLGFYKRAIGLLVNLGPVPLVAYVLSHPLAVKDIDAVVTFLFSFIGFAIFVGFYTRHRDEEVRRAAMAEEAERSAETMRQSDERFRLLGLATNDLVWDADLKSGRMWWNDTLLDVYGYDPKAFCTDMNAWESWIHPDDHDRVVESFQSMMRSGGKSWTSEYRMVCADGQIIDVVDRCIVLRNDAGESIRMIGSTTDVTELRVLEKRLRHSEKMDAVGQLTEGIAHDFNNLLTIIVGNAEILTELNADAPRSQKLAEVTLQAAERGAALISRLLSFARLQPLAPERIDPPKLLSGIESLLRRAINADIEISISAADSVWPIEVDPGQFENAVLNLVINARDAMPDGGRLSITASNVTLEEKSVLKGENTKQGRYVMITFADSGTGMPSDVADRAFEPYFTTKESGNGSGLGLSMVWGFVQQSNGHCHIISKPSEGTSVELYFPASNKRQTQETKPMNNGGLVGGTERILVVEDDEMVRTYVVSQLLGLGYTIKAASSAAEALEIMDSGWTFDLLFTDVVMPGGMNGRQLVEAAKLRQSELKVLFTSGYTEQAIVHQGRLDPGLNLLGKPYRRAELAKKVRYVLDE